MHNDVRVTSNTDSIRFGDIRYGQFFIHDSQTYMKVSSAVAICLRTSQEQTFGGAHRVTPLPPGATILITIGGENNRG